MVVEGFDCLQLSIIIKWLLILDLLQGLISSCVGDLMLNVVMIKLLVDYQIRMNCLPLWMPPEILVSLMYTKS